MQNEITKPIALVQEDGRVSNEGWARQPLWDYNRKAIHAPWYRIKEWDYYYILSDDLKRGITMTVSDLGYAGLMAICWLDFENNTFTQVDTLAAFPKGSITKNPNSMHYEDKHLSISYEITETERKLHFSSAQLQTAKGETGLHGELVLYQGGSPESMNIATSWEENRKRFYYNRKLNCMPASGTVKLGSSSYTFHPEKDSGAIDWGRGAWTYQNRWFWSSASGYLNGQPFGFNLGYGFSDRSPASENMIFYQHKAHKLADITFHYDEKDYLKAWKITSSDKRFEMDFTPCVDRIANTNLLLIQSFQHQVFGRFTGYAVLDDGTKLEVKDFLGFAEDVFNKW